MDLLEFIIIILILGIIAFLGYYFLKGQKGKISLAHPVESRVDEYLDRRFQSMVEEWQLVTHSKLQKFRETGLREIEGDEARLLELKNYESGMQTMLDNLEARLDTLENELNKKENSKK